MVGSNSKEVAIDIHIPSINAFKVLRLKELREKKNKDYV